MLNVLITIALGIIICLALGVMAYTYYLKSKQDSIVNSLPGSCFITRSPFGLITTFGLQGDTINDAIIPQLSSLNTANELFLDHPALTETGIVKLVKLIRPRLLVIYGNFDGDLILENLCTEPYLKELELQRLPLTANARHHLGQMRNLRRVMLSANLQGSVWIKQLMTALPKCEFVFISVSEDLIDDEHEIRE